MPHPCPHHCPPEGGGGLVTAAGVLVLVLIGTAVARPVIHAGEVALDVLVITAGCLAAAGLMSVAAVLALRFRRRQLAARPPLRLLRVRPVQAIRLTGPEPSSGPPCVGTARARTTWPRSSTASCRNPGALSTRLTSAEREGQ